MLDASAKEAINLLRNLRQKVEAPIKSLQEVRLEFAGEPQVTASGGLFVFERRFDISNYHFSTPGQWTPVALPQGKARFESMKLPLAFRPVSVAAYAVVVSGFGSDTRLHLQIVPANLADSTHINDASYHLGVNDLVFDGSANPVQLLKVSNVTKGPDLIVKAESDAKLILEEGDLSCTVASGEVRCGVAKDTTCGQLVDYLAKSQAAKFFKVKLLSDPATPVNLTVETIITFKPNNHLSACKKQQIEAYQGLAVVGMMPNPALIIHYEVQLYVVCAL